ncbi:MAG: hypothetical protein HY810_04230 [Candidatus Omnitrophica bacterium]|nr:hypothetical protein [Candidatus Omnitrophota bacterium]
MTLKNRGRLLIYNARLILENSIKDNSWVLIDKGKIGGFGSGKKPLLDKGTFLIDCRNNYLSPGLIDLHIHGDIEKISQTQACSGTTGFLLSLYAANFEDISRKIIQLKNMPLKAAQCLGFHLEGPFISREMAGAQPKEFISNPKIVLFKKLLKKIKDDIKIITFACELPGSGKFLKELKKNDIVAALGHTNATFEQAERAVSSGACYSTHIFNRMKGKIKKGFDADILIFDENFKAKMTIVGGKVVYKK